MQNEKETVQGISGYEFVQRILRLHPEDSVETLLEYTHNSETDFLELKASIKVRACDLNPRESPDDIYWNIARELIAMINSRGGVLFIGVSDGQDHQVVPLTSKDDKRTTEAYIREEIKSHVLPSTKKWSYKGTCFIIEEDISQYVECRIIQYSGHDICALLVRPCGRDDFIVVRQNSGKPGPELCPVRTIGDIGQCTNIEGVKRIMSYVNNRKQESSRLAIDAKRFEKEFHSKQESDTDDFVNSIIDQELREKIKELIKSELQKNRGMTDVGNLPPNASSKGHSVPTPPPHASICPSIDVTYKILELENERSRIKILKQLKGKPFEAMCIKACGSVGFLQHPSFENGIFVHVSVTNNILLAEGQKWRVTVGARFNEKRGIWCYSATSAKLLGQSNRIKFSYKLLETDSSRHQTVESLRGKFYEAYCKVGNGTYGYLSHPDFEGQIYIDVPVTSNVPIHEGQKWRFEIGAHCLPPNGLWIYRARNASLIEEKLRYLLQDIATPDSRNRTLESLKGIVLEAQCTNANVRGTCGLLSHANFEGDIYIDVPVTKGVRIHVGQTWQFEVRAHRMGPNGPWVYRAYKAILVNAASNVRDPNDSFQKAQSQTGEPITPAAQATSRQSYLLSEISDPNGRTAVEARLAGRQFEAVCIKSFDAFGFLANASFEGNLFIHHSVANDTPIIVGEKWQVEVGTLFNSKKQQWCYCVKSGHVCKGNAQDAPTPVTSENNSIPLPQILNTTHITIYIDETWPGAQDATYKDVGVIGGIAVPWTGTDETRLPILKTHLGNGSTAKNAINTLLARPEVFPFVFPIKFNQIINPGGKQYFELVQHALMLLLGWMLPPRNQPTTVDIYLEHISGFMDSHDETDFIKSLIQAMRLLSNGKRFANWDIRNVKWVNKDFGYVPYGDLVCKTCVPLKEQQILASKVKVREWEGFLPFSKDVFPLLREMDTASPAGLADLLVSFAKVASDTPLFRRIRKMAIERAKSDPTFRDAIFSRFEECYAQPERDIALLNRVVPHFLKEFLPDTFKSTPRTQLLRILIGFQHANHNGDPDLANALADDYRSLRPRMINLDRDLCAYADLNLAVHLHDSFDFSSALALAKAWIDDPLFPALSIVNQGRMFSSYGQSLALLGRFLEADEAFTKALVQFMSEPELLAKDIEQTTTYRAINLLDINSRSAIPLIESLLKGSILSSVSELDTVLARPFIAHLLLKALWRLRIDLPNERDAFLKHLPKKISVKDQHPYELVLFYLALLTKETVPSYANAQVIKMEEVFAQMEFGGTLGLIHAFLRVMLKRHGLNTIREKEFLDELNIVAQYLPNASTIITTLQSAWTDSTIPIDDILPFNYC